LEIQKRRIPVNLKQTLDANKIINTFLGLLGAWLELDDVGLGHFRRDFSHASDALCGHTLNEWLFLRLLRHMHIFISVIKQYCNKQHQATNLRPTSNKKVIKKNLWIACKQH
jgi:hypothetical protein